MWRLVLGAVAAARAVRRRVGPAAQVGTDDETVAARVAELGRLLATRQAAGANRADRADRADRAAFLAHVLVLDGARSLRAVPGVAALLRAGPGPRSGSPPCAWRPRSGCCPRSARPRSPSTRAGAAMWPSTRRASHRGMRFAPRACRWRWPNAAPVRDSSPRDDEPALPGSARLLDLLGLEPPTPDGVRRRW